MKIATVKTHKITLADKSIYGILDKYIPRLRGRTIVAITSKIVSICEKRVVKIGDLPKKTLIEKEADFYLPHHLNKYNITLTIKNNLLVPSAGIDESNGNGYFILWPKTPQKTANETRNYLRKKFSLKNIGVIITDSRTLPLRRGVTGASLSHSGFSALNDYRGQPDIFGKKLKITRANVADALAAAAVAAMGEGNEQTPLAIISDVSFVKFQSRNPSSKELKELQIKKEEDLYGTLLTSVKWLRSKR